MQGLNLRLQPCKGSTLPTELIARKTGELISTHKNCVKQKLLLSYVNNIFQMDLCWFDPEVMVWQETHRMEVC